MSITSKMAALAAAAFILSGGVAHAQSLTGSWQAMTARILFQLTVQPSGAYIESQRSGSIMTQQAGAVTSAGPGLVAFTVVNWAPRTMPRYVATGASGGYWTQIPTTRPPGGVWRIMWNGPNSFTLTDVRLGGSVTFNRVG